MNASRPLRSQGEERRVVLVTGATGFLGAATVLALVARGDDVRALVRPRADDWRLRGHEVTRIVGDVTDAPSLDAAMRGVQAVVHCAGMLGRAGVHEAVYDRVHVAGTLAVLRAADAAGVPRVVHLSSPGVLGFIEGPAADEDAPPRPTNAYERSKARAERAIAALPEATRARVVIVRPEFVYGPLDTHVLRLFRAVARGRFPLIGRGEALCHPTYVDDAIAGVLAALDRGTAGRTYHVAGPRAVEVRAFVTAIARALGVRPPGVRVPAMPLRVAARASERAAAVLGIVPPITTSAIDFFDRSRHFSWARAARELGYAPRVDIDEGTMRTVRWAREKGLLE